MATETSAAGDRRPQKVAAVGFYLTVASTAVLVAIATQQGSSAVHALWRFSVIAIPIWAVLYLVLKQSARVQAEALETAELQRARQAGMSTALFEADDEGLLIEQSRLHWLARWMLPAVTILLSILLIVGHFGGWRWTFQNAFSRDVFVRTKDATLVMWFVVGVGFVNFLYARYSLALARLPGWRILHAGGVCMAAGAMACLAMALALMATTTIAWAEPLVAYLIRGAMLILGIELAVNYILDFYRPRVKGEIPRPSFDSRILGLVGEPGGIAKSIAEALNYQFGFEVSSTWFYQLLRRWMFPLTVLTAVVVLMLTSVVIVDAGEEVVIERWGQPIESGGKVLGPGVHLKWPYPMDVVFRSPARQINEIVLGEASESESEEASRKAIVWTEAHDYVPELMVLVAAPKSGAAEEKSAATQSVAQAEGQSSESVPVSLLMLSVPIQYRIKDTRKFLYNYEDPVKLLENVAYQHLSDYAAGVDIDALMGPGRDRINAELASSLQKRLDALDVGIEIAFVGIRGAHPPARDEVAQSFQKVIASQIGMGSLINAAQGEARKTLIQAAGTEAQAIALDDAIRRREALRENPKTGKDELAAATAAVEELLSGNADKGIVPVGGAAAARIANARTRGEALKSDALVKARSFGTDVVAFLAAPDLFKVRKTLELYANLDNIRKYLIVGDAKNVTIIYETAEEGGLDRVLTEGIDKEAKARSGK